jgi:hypothetical protein
MAAHFFKWSLAAAALIGGASVAFAADAASESPMRELQADYAAALADASEAAEAAEAARNHALGRLLNEIDLGALDDASSADFIAGELGHPHVIVKNAPYTAEAVTETVRTLADGNRIVHKTTTLLARDGYGRTRQERKGGRRHSVWMGDGSTSRVSVDKRVTTPAPAVPAPPAPPAPPVPPVPGAVPQPPAPPMVTEVTPGRIIVRRGDKGEERVEVIRIDRTDAGPPPGIPMPPLALPSLPRRGGEKKDLGTREFEGVKAQGTQTTYTIPAGEIGNERPIVVTSERWFSPELHVVVYAKTSDPRAGDTTYRLTNIKRGEPPAELFQKNPK